MIGLKKLFEAAVVDPQKIERTVKQLTQKNAHADAVAYVAKQLEDPSYSSLRTLSQRLVTEKDPKKKQDYMKKLDFYREQILQQYEIRFGKDAGKKLRAEF